MTAHASYPSAPLMTVASDKTAGLTGVTGQLDFLSMTDDRLPQVPPYNARTGEGNRGPDVHASSVSTRKPRRPPWLYDGPLTDRARLISCNRCRRPVLEALADGVMPARVDLIHLTPAQELQHLLAGRMTLRLWPDPASSDERRLAFRHAWNIQARPGRGLPLHDCAVVRQPDPSLLTHRALSAWPEEPSF